MSSGRGSRTCTLQTRAARRHRPGRCGAGGWWTRWAGARPTGTPEGVPVPRPLRGRRGLSPTSCAGCRGRGQRTRHARVLQPQPERCPNPSRSGWSGALGAGHRTTIRVLSLMSAPRSSTTTTPACAIRSWLEHRFPTPSRWEKYRWPTSKASTSRSAPRPPASTRRSRTSIRGP